MPWSRDHVQALFPILGSLVAPIAIVCVALPLALASAPAPSPQAFSKPALAIVATLPVQDRASPAPVVKAAAAPISEQLARARVYLMDTAHPGGSMSSLGKKKALECFHPQFALSLAAAVEDARAHGLPRAGVLSGCRPPSLGIGGFRDKFNSLHAYGLAADMNGIGAPGSSQTRLWQTIAARHGVACVYGPYNRAEWNHCQGTLAKIAPGYLRKTITARGPIDLDRMWAAAKSIVLAALHPIGAGVIAAKASLQHVAHHVVAAAHRHRHRVRVRVASSMQPTVQWQWHHESNAAWRP